MGCIDCPKMTILLCISKWKIFHRIGLAKADISSGGVALLFLLPISWGAFNGVLPEAALPYVETVQDSATAVYVLGLVAALLERKLDAEVIEM